MACDIDQLLEDNKCFQSLSEDQQLIAIAQLLCDISQSSNAIVAAGAPEGVQAGTIGRLYWDSTGNALYVKETGDGTTTGWIAV